MHVRTDKGNELGEILIGAEIKEERDVIRQLLLMCGIEPSKDKTIKHQGSVLMHGRTNFEKVAYWKLCDLHPKKKERFYFGMGNFKSFQYRKGEAKKLILKSLVDGAKDAKLLAEELRINIGTIKSEHLFTLVKNGLLIQSKPTKTGRVYKKFYSLTESGLKAAKENKNIY
ncbi:MAG: helix-turn-helix transcriptional regulator [Candidatus Aenigmarchaeota archaeon]|nr:helix-turn-helix transcriptional regulator [Candidatus Aenigmarchaeota archaeon]